MLPDYPNYSLAKNKMMLPVVKGEILAIERSEWVFYSVFPGSCHHYKELRNVHISRQGHIAEDFREAFSLDFEWFLFGDKVLCFPG